MSNIRYKLLQLLPTFNIEANQIKDKEILQRWEPMRKIILSKKSIVAAARAVHRSTDFFEKWAHRLLSTKSLTSLKGLPRVPHKIPHKTPQRIERKILALRAVEPYQGCDRISDDLNLFYKINCPARTINDILNRNGKISKKKAKALTKRHLKRYRRLLPGYLQLDFKYVPYKVNNKQYYQLSCIDHHSSWRLIRSYTEKSTLVVIEFLKELIELVPFAIMQIQTDNDAAFTDKYTSQLGRPTGSHPLDLWCEQNGIEHKLNPIGQKELNGKVQNSHKQDDREFYSQFKGTSFGELKQSTKLYEYRWNHSRRVRSLQKRTPEEVISQSYINTLFYLNTIKEKYTSNAKPFIKILSTGDLVHQFKIIKPKKKNKTKKISFVNRYLQYLKWEEQNCVIFLPPIFLQSSFSH